jgi:protein ImuB
MQRRVVSMWFPRLASDRVLRTCPTEAPFALTLKQDNIDRLYCLNAAAERRGLYRGMSCADARAFNPDLQTNLADPQADLRFLHALRRWATRYCPWVGLEGEDGLILDVTGAAHLWGGEAAMLDDMRERLKRARMTVKLGLADTRGAAWALAHHGGGLAAPGDMAGALGPLPVAALRLDADLIDALRRLGLATIADLEATPRAPLGRRFGPVLLRRLDQALGRQPEEITPLPDPPHYAVRMTLPDPIGLVEDVMAGIARLLGHLCAKLKARGAGARALRLTLRRVDQGNQQVDLRLASAMCDPARILPLFERGVAGIDAGFGIDQLRLEAVQVDPLAVHQFSHDRPARQDALDDLITRIGARIGLENVQRFVPADTHIPERGFHLVPVAYSRPAGFPFPPRPRPLLLFPPEPIAGFGPQPPGRFRWRRMSLTTARATGPERITPEWWREDENWRTGLRDYWHVETREGRRLWMFHTPQAPGWCVQGEFA